MKTVSEQNKQYYQKHRDRLLKKSNDRYADKKEEMNEKRKAWYKENKERQRKSRLIWCENNRFKINSYVNKRYALKKQRTPLWLTEDDFWMIEQAYELAELRTKLLKVKFEVDHIIPIHGKTVSGLHVPENLQVIPAVLNKQKSNHFLGA